VVLNFGGTLKTLKELFKLQKKKKSMRLIANISSSTSCKPFLKKERF
jgi:hypothetical protein